MKAIVMKEVAQALSLFDGVFPASRNALRAVIQPKKQTGSAAAQPHEAEASDPHLLEPTMYRFFLWHSLSRQLILISFTLISFLFLYFSLSLLRRSSIEQSALSNFRNT